MRVRLVTSLTLTSRGAAGGGSGIVGKERLNIKPVQAIGELCFCIIVMNGPCNIPFQNLPQET